MLDDATRQTLITGVKKRLNQVLSEDKWDKLNDWFTEWDSDASIPAFIGEIKGTLATLVHTIEMIE